MNCTSTDCARRSVTEASSLIRSVYSFLTCLLQIRGKHDSGCERRQQTSQRENLVRHSVISAGHHTLAAGDVDGELVGPLAVLYPDHGFLLAEEDFGAERE